MSENKNDKNLNEKDLQNADGEEDKKSAAIYFFIALGCFAVGCALFALAMVFTFAVKNGTAYYFIIATMISELAAVSFLNAQKKKGGDGKLRFAFVILSYIVMGAALAIFLMGTVASGIAG